MISSLSRFHLPPKKGGLYLAVLLIIGNLADAQTTTWTGSGPNWSGVTDWTTGVPVAANTAEFDTSFTIQPMVTMPMSPVGGIYVTTGVTSNVVISGPGSLQLTGNLPPTTGPGGLADVGILLDDSANNSLKISSDIYLIQASNFLVNNAGTLTISGNLFLSPGADLTLGSTTAAGTGNIVISGHIGGPSSVTFAADNTDAHSQSLTLSGNNNYIGFNLLPATAYASTTNVNFNSTGALAGGTFNIGPSGSGSIASFDNTSGTPLVVTGATQTWGGDFTFVGTNDLTFGMGSGTITLGTVSMPAPEITVNVESGTLTETDSIINGTANTLIVRSFDPATSLLGTGTLMLTANSNYSGGTQILNGTVVTGATSALGVGPVVMAPLSGAILQENAPLKIDSLSTGIDFPGFSGGSLYTVAPTVEISGGGGTGATAVATIAVPTGGAGGPLVLTITNEGSNYTSAPTFTLVGGESTGTFATFSPVGYAASQIQLPTPSDDLVLLGGNTSPVVYTGVISGSGQLTKTGAGTEILTNANTYTGPTMINSGTLTFLNTSATQALNIGGSAAEFDYDPVSFASLNLNSLSISNSTMGFVIGGTGTQVGTIVNSSTAPATTSGTIPINIVVNGAVTPGTTFDLINWTSGGLTGASYTLGTVYDDTGFTISSVTATPTLVSITTTPSAPLPTAYWKGAYVPADNVWAASDGVTMSNWTTDAAGLMNTPLVPGPTTAVIFSAAGAMNYGSMVLGSSMSIDSLTISNPSPVVLNADGNTLTVALAITVNTTSDDILGADLAGAATVSNLGAGMLTLLGTNSYTGQTVVGPGSTIQIGNGGVTGTLGTSAPVADAGSLILNRYGTLSVPNMIVGSGDVSVIGPGLTYLLNNANSYLGPTTIDTGVLNAASLTGGGGPSSLGASAPTAGDLIFGDGTLQYNNGSGAGMTDRLFTIGDTAGNSATLDSSSPSTADTVNFTNTGAIAFGTSGPHTITFTGSNTGTNSFAPVIADAGIDQTSLIKADGGLWQLSGTNTYTGTTSVHGGTLQADVAGGMGLPGAFGLNSAVIMSNVAGATLDLNSFNTQIGSLTGGGTVGGNVTLGTADLFVGSDNTSPAAFGGVISGSGGLLKIGTGILTLSNSNTYTSGTGISGGAGIAITGGVGSTPPTTTITGSAIDLVNGSGSSGQLAATPVIKLNGGSLIFGAGDNNAVSSSVLVAFTGVSTTQVVALNGTSQTFGSLSLNALGGTQNYIDLTNGGGLLTLNDVGPWAAGAMLDIVGWVGPTSTMGDATHQIDLSATAIADFTPADLADVTWTGVSTDGGVTYGNITGAQIVGSELVPLAVPEPTTIFVSLCLLGLLGWNGRRRLADAGRIFLSGYSSR